jgi:peptidoglycan endopeptidase LytF
MTSLFHQVIAGETLAGIARQYKTSASTLKKLNGLSSSELYADQELLIGIFEPGKEPAFTPKTNEKNSLDHSFDYHVVAAGDTLYNISKRNGLKVQELKALNHLTDDVIQIGKKLIVRVHRHDVVYPPPLPEPSKGGTVSTIDYPQFPIKTIRVGKKYHYELMVPLQNGKTVIATLKDAPSRKPTGIYYVGLSKIKVNHKELLGIGLTERIATALECVSDFEGDFDAINTYDRAIFSYGFIQFVGLSTYGGSLNQLLASMKNKSPEAFARIFESVGISIIGKTTHFIDKQGNKYLGDKAWYAIKKHVPIFGTFIQAGFELSLVMEQYRMANVLYAQPALKGQLVLNLSGKKVTGLSLQEVLISEAMQTIAIAVAINQGQGGMVKVITQAIAKVAVDLKLKSKADLAKLDEKAVCQKIIQTSQSSGAVERAKGVLKKGLSFKRN